MSRHTVVDTSLATILFMSKQNKFIPYRRAFIPDMETSINAIMAPEWIR